MSCDMIRLSDVLDVAYNVDVSDCESLDDVVAKIYEAIGELDPVDAVPVVRCKDCFYANPFFGDDYVRCAVWGEDIRKDGYCYCGKRKKGEG